MDDGKEGLSIAKIGLGIIIFLILVGVVFAIVRLGSSKVNESTNDLANTMDSAQMMQYARYDNSEVVGSDVLNAAKNYQNSNIKIFVATKATLGDYYDPGDTSEALSNEVYSYGYMGVSENTDAEAPEYSSDTGNWIADIIPEGDETRNANYSPMTNKNNSNTYVRPSARYWSYLVYDENTGEMAGIMFLQTK